MLKKISAHLRTTPSPQLALALCGSVLVGLLVSAGAVDGGLVLRLREPIQVLTGAVFFGAGLLLLTLWHGDRAPTRAQGAGMLLALGFLAPWNVSMGPLLHGDVLNAVLSPLTAALVALVALAIGGVLSAGIPPRVRVTVGLSATATLVLGLVLTPLFAGRTTGLELDLGPRAVVGLELAVAALWLTARGICAMRLRHVDDVALARVAPVLAGLGVVWVLRSLAVIDVAAWSLAASLFLLSIAVVVLCCVAGDYTKAAGEGRERLDSTEQALGEVAQAFATLDHERRNFAHDARNVILALQAASQTLAEHGDRLDAEVRRRLRLAIVDELDQLHRMLTTPTGDTRDEVDVADVIGTVVATERMNGLDVQMDLQPCRARTSKHDLTRVLRNLLVNAREHAPRSPVLVRARDEGGFVRISVEDRGPGVPRQLRPVLFDRGVTTKPTGGSGLGLNVSRSLMQEQGGDLRFTEGAKGGACFELTLPSAERVFGGHASGSTAALTVLEPLPGQAWRSA